VDPGVLFLLRQEVPIGLRTFSFCFSPHSFKLIQENEDSIVIMLLTVRANGLPKAEGRSVVWILLFITAGYMNRSEQLGSMK
jgi:hypothetical protein